MSKITEEEFKRLFERNEDLSYKNLIIPPMWGFPRMDLRNKKPSDYTIEEIIMSKKYKSFLREELKANKDAEDEQNSYLTLGDKRYAFEPNGSALNIYYNPNTDIISAFDLDLKFKEGLYDGKISISPTISINKIDFKGDKIEDLHNMTFSIKTPEESIKREDIFYTFEHEPFLNYELKIAELKDNKVHIIISGDAITDDYSTDSKGEHFYADVVVKIVFIPTCKKIDERQTKSNNSFPTTKLSMFIGIAIIALTLYYLISAISGATSLGIKGIIMALCGLIIGSILLFSNIRKGKKSTFERNFKILLIYSIIMVALVILTMVLVFR